MLNVRKWWSGRALVITGLMTTSSVAPLMMSAPAFAQSRSYDVQAQACIEQPAQRNIIGKAFPNAAQARSGMQFSDVPICNRVKPTIAQPGMRRCVESYAVGVREKRGDAK